MFLLFFLVREMICLLKDLVLWGGKNFFKNYSYILFEVLIDLNLRFCNLVLALSFDEKWKTFNLIIFVLQFWSVYVLQTFSKSLRCKYGFSYSKLWNVGKSWIMLSLKLNRDASRGNTIHKDATILIRFM